MNSCELVEKLARLIRERNCSVFKCALWSVLNKDYECPAFCTGCSGYVVENEMWEVLRYA